MPAKTYHVALAFQSDEEGELHAVNAKEAPTPQSAIARAKRLAKVAKGAAAFSRYGDTDTGVYSDPKIHLILGEAPLDVRRYVMTSA